MQSEEMQNLILVQPTSNNSYRECEKAMKLGPSITYSQWDI